MAKHRKTGAAVALTTDNKASDPVANRKTSELYPGVISPSDLYSVDELKRRLRLQETALRSARRKGLLVLRFGNRAYYYGADVIAFLRSVSSLGSSE